MKQNNLNLDYYPVAERCLGRLVTCGPSTAPAWRSSGSWLGLAYGLTQPSGRWRQCWRCASRHRRASFDHGTHQRGGGPGSCRDGQPHSGRVAPAALRRRRVFRRLGRRVGRDHRALRPGRCRDASPGSGVAGRARARRRCRVLGSTRPAASPKSGADARSCSGSSSTCCG